MVIYIIRHGAAGSPGDSAWPSDAQRPLTAEGRERFARVVKALAAQGFAPGIVATSPLVRCHQTAELVAAGVPNSPEVVDCDALAPGSNLSAMLKWTARHTDLEAVAWVGHAPDVSYLAGALIGGGAVDFTKGAVAAIDFDDKPKIGEGILRWLVTAKVLGC